MAKLCKYFPVVVLLLNPQWTGASFIYRYTALPPAEVEGCNPYNTSLRLAATVSVVRVDGSTAIQNGSMAEEDMLIWSYASCGENMTELSAVFNITREYSGPYQIQQTLEVLDVHPGVYYMYIQISSSNSTVLLSHNTTVHPRSEYNTSLGPCNSFLSKNTTNPDISTTLEAPAVVVPINCSTGSVSSDMPTTMKGSEEKENIILYLVAGLGTVLAVLVGCVCLVSYTLCKKRQSKLQTGIRESLIHQTHNDTPNSDSVIPISNPEGSLPSLPAINAGSYRSPELPTITNNKPYPPPREHPSTPDPVVHIVDERDSGLYHNIEEEDLVKFGNGMRSALPQPHTVSPGTAVVYHINNPSFFPKDEEDTAQHIYTAATDETLDQDHVYEKTNCKTLEPPEVMSKDSSSPYHGAHPKLKKRSNPYTRPLPRPPHEKTEQQVKRKKSEAQSSEGYQGLQMMDYASIYTEGMPTTVDEDGMVYHQVHTLRKQSDHVYTMPEY